MNCHFSQLAGVVFVFIVGVLVGYFFTVSGHQASGTAQAMATDAAAKQAKVARTGMVVGLRPDKKDYYNALHAKPWPEINAMIKKGNIRNFSIYETEIEGKLYLFGYYEYVGDDFKGDMAKIAADPKTQEWWKETNPCQIRLPGAPEGEQWLNITEVYHLD
jgi:L-rhamnose mutarotase